jgi:dTDP-4-dehydrorhamnose 3,5-epimerase
VSGDTGAYPLLETTAPRFDDARGWLQVLYETDSTILKRSYSRAGVFRGMHGQTAPSPQTKIIRVVSGRIIDFLISLDDPKRNIVHREIGPEDGWIRIAAHYVHGFYALEETLFEYVCDGRYDAASEQAYSIVEHLRGMGIVDPIMSAKDLAAPPLVPVSA